MASTGWVGAARSRPGEQSLITVMASAVKRSGVVSAAVFAVIIRFVLVFAGLGLICASLWMLAMPAGLAACGVACLIVEWVIKR